MMPEEVLECRIPLVVSGAERSFEDHRFDVVIENLLGEAAEVLKGIQVTLDKGEDIGGEGEGHIPHPGVPEDHAKAVYLPSLSIHVLMPAFGPVDLRLNAGLGLIPEDCRHRGARPDCPDMVFDDRVLPRITLSPDLPKNTGSTEWIVGYAVLDVVFVVIKFARFAGSRLGRGGVPEDTVVR